MKFVFFGTSDFAVAILEKLLSDFYFPELVVTQPDRPVGRKQTITPPPVKDVCDHHRLRIAQPERAEELKQLLTDLNPDVFIVAAYGQIISKDLLAIPKQGAINVHGSILPFHRGASPIQSAILHGDEVSGISIMQMDEKMDHGPVYFIKHVPISPADTYQSLHAKLAQEGADTLTKCLPDILKGKLKPLEQDHEQATYTKLISKEDAKIDWKKTAAQIDRQIRAYYDKPIAWTKFEDGPRIKILQANLVPQTDQPHAPGTVFAADDHLYIQASDAPLQITLLQPEGKSVLSADAFLRGYQQLLGKRCE